MDKKMTQRTKENDDTKKIPTYIIIQDIGSGLNLNKRGIRKIIKLAIENKINKLVIAYRDRLTRFGYELIEDLVKTYSKGEIIVLNEKDKLEPEEEIVQDLMAIMNVYIAKMNGLRKYNKQIFYKEISSFMLLVASLKLFSHCFDRNYQEYSLFYLEVQLYIYASQCKVQYILCNYLDI